MDIGLLFAKYCDVKDLQEPHQNALSQDALRKLIIEYKSNQSEPMPKIGDKEPEKKILTKLFTWLKWILLNGGYAVIIYLALFEHQLWAVNIVMFGTHLLFIRSILMAIYYNENEDERIEVIDKMVVPKSIDIGYDLIITMVFASQGWFYTATIYFLHLIAQSSIHSKGKP